jgi:hypothetical protein
MGTKPEPAPNPILVNFDHRIGPRLSELEVVAVDTAGGNTEIAEEKR